MRVRNPSQLSSKGGRPAIPAGLLSVFGLSGKERATGICVPLVWKREIYLPPERTLEAWYFLPDSSKEEGWRIDPREVAASPDHELEPFVFDASIEPDQAKHRIACAGLITDLGKRSGNTVWIASEPKSISIWSDAAFQIWHHHLMS